MALGRARQRAPSRVQKIQLQDLKLEAGHIQRTCSPGAPPPRDQSSGGPSVVCVLPAPDTPYARTVAFTPANTSGTMGAPTTASHGVEQVGWGGGGRRWICRGSASCWLGVPGVALLLCRPGAAPSKKCCWLQSAPAAQPNSKPCWGAPSAPSSDTLVLASLSGTRTAGVAAPPAGLTLGTTCTAWEPCERRTAISAAMRQLAFLPIHTALLRHVGSAESPGNCGQACHRGSRAAGWPWGRLDRVDRCTLLSVELPLPCDRAHYCISMPLAVQGPRRRPQAAADGCRAGTSACVHLRTMLCVAHAPQVTCRTEPQSVGCGDADPTPVCSCAPRLFRGTMAASH